MKKAYYLITAAAFMFALSFTSCNNTSGEKSEKEHATVEAEKGEHSRDVGEGGEGEEDGTQIARTDVYDAENEGTHLILKYDEESNAFVGTVENKTEDLIEKVRVEVHLSNGIELGPTTPIDLKPGGIIEIKLDAEGQEFETWSTHAEVGSGEHSHEGEGEHSHDEEGEGEHK